MSYFQVPFLRDLIPGLLSDFSSLKILYEALPQDLWKLNSPYDLTVPLLADDNFWREIFYQKFNPERTYTMDYKLNFFYYGGVSYLTRTWKILVQTVERIEKEESLYELFWVGSQLGSLKLMQYAMKDKITIDTLNDSISFAAQNGHLFLVKYLIDQGANPNYDADKPFRLAAGEGHIEVIKYLTDPASRALDPKGPAWKAADISAVEHNALRLAAFHGHIEVVKFLIDHGADVRARSNQALIQAAVHHHPKVVQLLLDNGADPNVLTKEERKMYL